MEAIVLQKDEEIANLLSENRLLNSEINQCKSDKEFVWSLWQQLQKSNPDVTQAVNYVMQREKGQNEQKDAKMLEILNAKDTEIRRLKNEVEILKSAKEDLTKTNRRLSQNFNEELNEVEALRREIENMTNTFEHIDPKLILPVVEKRLTRISGELNTKTLINQFSSTSVAIESDYVRANARVSSKVNALHTEIVYKLNTLEELALEVERLSAENNSLREVIENLESSCITHDNEMSEEHQKLLLSQEECDNFRSEIEKQNYLLVQLEQTKKETERITRENEDRNQKINCEIRRNLDLKEREIVKLNTELEKKSSTVETLKLENKELKTTVEQNKIKFDEQTKCLKLKFAENEDRLKNNLTDQDLKFNNRLKLAEEKCREDNIDLKNNLEKEIRSREENYKRKTEALVSDLSEELKQKLSLQKSQFTKELEDKEFFYEKVLQEERLSFEKRLKSQEEESCQKQLEVDLNNKRKQQTLEREFHQRVEDIEKDYSAEVKKLKESHKNQLEKSEEYSKQNIKENQEKCSEDIKRKEKKYQFDINFLEEKVRSLDQEYKKKLQSESRKYRQEIEKQEEKYQCLKLQLERKLCQLEVEQREKEERELFQRSLDNIACKNRTTQQQTSCISNVCGRSRSVGNNQNINSKDCDTSVDNFIFASTPISSPKRGRKNIKKRKKRSASAFEYTSRCSTPTSMCYTQTPQSPGKELILARKKIQSLETKVDCMKILLTIKKDEIRSLLAAHERRLKRLQSLQKDFKKMIQKCDQAHFCISDKNNRLMNESVGMIFQEDSETDKVWNENACLKRDNKVLRQEKYALEDDIDRLQVKISRDKATIQELLLGFLPENSSKNSNKKKHKKLEISSSQKISCKKSDSSFSKVSWRKVDVPGPSCGQFTKGPQKNYLLRQKVKNLNYKLRKYLQDLQKFQIERKNMNEQNNELKNEIIDLRKNVIDSKNNEKKIRNEIEDMCEVLKEKDENIEQLILKKDQNIQEIKNMRSENDNLRWENDNLITEIKKSKQEIYNQQQKLKTNPNFYSSQLSSVSSKVKKSNVGKTSRKNFTRKIKFARKHQKFLNKSVKQMQKLFGNFVENATLTSTIATDKSSDISSLGEIIVSKAKHNVPEYKKKSDSLAKSSNSLYQEENYSSAARFEKLSDNLGTNKNVESSSVIKNKNSSQKCQQLLSSSVHLKLKQLQKQSESLKKTKAFVTTKLDEEKEKTINLTKELENYKNKLKLAKQNISRLQNEVEMLKMSKTTLHDKIDKYKLEQQKYTDKDYKLIENKLKSANHEQVKLSTKIHELKKDMDIKNIKIQSGEDKILRLERDVNMKRKLLENLKEKQFFFTDSLNKLQLQTEKLSKTLANKENEIIIKRNTIDSCRTQIQVLIKDKKDSEAKLQQVVSKSIEQVELIENLKFKNERYIKLENEKHSDFKQQLSSLANKSEEAIDKLNWKVEKSAEKIKEFGDFVNVLTTKILTQLTCYRDFIHDRKIYQIKHESAKVERENLNKANKENKIKMSENAKKIACQVLEISGNELSDLMQPVLSPSLKSNQNIQNKKFEQVFSKKILEEENDECWKKTVDNITKRNFSPPFAKTLCRLFWDKFEDCLRLLEDKINCT